MTKYYGNRNRSKKAHLLIAERLSARQLILLRISFCVGMYVCMSVTLRNANFDTLRTRISVSCMLHVKGVRKGRGRTIAMNVASNTKNGKKTMHADAMDGWLYFD